MLTVDLSQGCKCKGHLKPAGDTLNSSSSLVSASETFSFSSCVHDDSSKSTSYVSIQSNKADGNIAWICNRKAPILYALLPWTGIKPRKLCGGDPNPIVIFSAPQTTRSKHK
ncbi:hypothetical protein ACFX13_036743 [Malus domestica]